MSPRSLARSALVLVIGVVLAACGGTATAPPQSGRATLPSAGAGQPTASATQATPGGGGAGGGSLFENAKAVKHFCELLPTNLVAGIVPDGGKPQEEQFPPTCSVYGSKTAMAIWLSTGVPLGVTPAGATAIAGLGTGAYLQRLSTGNFTLYVGLSPEAGVLGAEVNNQDGKDHTDEAVNVAKAVLQKLGG